MHNQHRSPDPTKIERATATSTVALFFYFFSAATRVIGKLELEKRLRPLRRYPAEVRNEQALLFVGQPK